MSKVDDLMNRLQSTEESVVESEINLKIAERVVSNNKLKLWEVKQEISLHFALLASEVEKYKSLKCEECPNCEEKK